jgi:F-type H+-transporting ATPase subunit a
MDLVLQKTVISILIVTAFCAALVFLFYSRLKKFDPLSEPKGLVLAAMMGVEYVEKMLRQATNEKITQQLGPYIASVMVYVFFANISGLFGIDPPTSNYSVTLALAAITCVLIEHYAIEFNGWKNYIKGLFEPLAPFVVMNLISKLGHLLSLSLRLFGNIISGSILMSVIYQMFAMLSSLVPVVGKVNFFGLIVCPFLHMYFDLFTGFMQSYLFSTLSVAFIGNELPSDARK